MRERVREGEREGGRGRERGREGEKEVRMTNEEMVEGGITEKTKGRRKGKRSAINT